MYAIRSYYDPGLALTGDWLSWAYVGALLGMLACVILLGHYGAILVSREAQQHRITSYNVCYTKLLRGRYAAGSARADRPASKFLTSSYMMVKGLVVKSAKSKATSGMSLT